MKKVVFFMGICTLLLSMNACKTDSQKTNQSVATVDNSQNSLDWQGTYYGTLPCADCPGIETVVTLNANGTYKMTSHYLEQEEQALFEYTGGFQWSKDGSIVILDDENGEVRKFKVGENKLFWLDLDGKEITGDLVDNYILNKVNSNLVEKYWKLTEIFGAPITEKDVTKDAFMTLRVIGKRVNGNLGCNSFFGTYETSGENQIKFSQVGSTMMMCPSMEVETKMKQILEQADSYYIKNDTLILNRARMAPLARFVAVYM